MPDSSQPAQLLTLEGVWFRYPSAPRDDYVLRGETLSILQPALIRLDGRNGAGKSTLLQLLAGLLTPTAGKIQAHGMNRGVVYLNQNPADFLGEALTVGEHIHIASAKSDKKASEGYVNEAKSLLQSFNLRLETKWNEFSFSLSGGQRQILSLICVLLAKPTLLILDEFTAYLDSSSAAQACKLVNDFRNTVNSTVIFVDQSHSLPIEPDHVINLPDLSNK